MTQINYIDDQGNLDVLVKILAKSSLFAIDTEFMRERTYHPTLSLIQLRVNGQNYIIDCLQSLNLANFLSLMESDKIKKVIHGARQDLEIFCGQLGLKPKLIFDTQIMANFSGYDLNCSYAYLVEDLCGKCLNKGLQRSDWLKRPLSPKQLEYAANDVVFLEEVYQKLSSNIGDRLDWCLEDLGLLIAEVKKDPVPRLVERFSFRGLSQEERLKISALIQIREELASKQNIPRQRLLSDHQIRDLAINGLSPRFKLAKEALSEIEEILNAEKLDNRFILKTRKSKLNSESKRALYTKTSQWLDKIALENNLPKSLLVSSQTLKQLIIDPELLDQEITGWRWQLFGRQLKQIISS